MGWSSWNSFGSNITKSNILAQADAIVKLGLRECGWEYINIDDCYQMGRDEKTGRLKINLEKFPNGEADLKYIADYCHKNGLKAGMYSDGGDNCCASSNKKPFGLNVGLYRHEKEDLEMFLGEGPGCWGYDFIKIDWCGGGHAKLKDSDQYNKIMDVIDDIEKRTGKDKIINICRWAYVGPWQFRADSWRSGPDIDMSGRSWESVMVQVDIMKEVWPYTRPGSMNDPDMLVCGLGLTPVEDLSHFAMWCMFSSPLLIGQDLLKIKPETLELYKNRELIALNQDKAVLSAAYLGEAAPGVEIWLKPLGCERSPVRALALLNRNSSETEVEFSYSDIGYPETVKARDLVRHVDLKPAKSRKVKLAPHGIDVVKLEPATGNLRVITPFAGAVRTKHLRSAVIERTRRIDWVNAARMVEAGALLLDVRSSEEFAAGHVQGAVNVPHTAISSAGKALSDTNRTVVAYCAIYKRAAQAAAVLDMMGFKRVYFVGDGYSKYSTEKQPTLADVKVELSSLKFHSAWPVARGKKNTSWNGKKINIRGIEYEKGVGTDATFHGDGSVTMVDIPAKATHFVSMVGRDRDISWSKANTAMFEVFADGKLLASSPEIGWDDDYLFSVKLPAGAKVLKLVTKGVPNGTHCSWGGAGFVVK